MGESQLKNVGDKITFAAQQLYAKIRFRCFVALEKKSVQDLGRKKEKNRKQKEKKRKKSHRRQNGLVGMKGYFKTLGLLRIVAPGAGFRGGTLFRSKNR